MTEACERWIEISDRLMVGEQIHASEREFVRRHEAACPACAAEAAALRELRPLPLHSVPERAEVDRILLAASDVGSSLPRISGGSSSAAAPYTSEDAQQETTLLYIRRQEPAPVLQQLRPALQQTRPVLEQTRPELQRTGTEPVAEVVDLGALRQRRWLVPALSACAFAAALVLAIVQLWGSDDNHAANATPAPHAKSSADSASQAAPLERRAQAPRTRNQEDTCGEVLPDITLCLTRGSEVSAVELNGRERTVYLERGRAIASLGPQQPGTSFSIVTSAGKVTAVGTVFSVEVTPEGSSIARVARGKVLVHALRANGDHALLAGQMLQLGERESLRLPPSEQQRDIALLDQLAPDSPGLRPHEAPNTRGSARNLKDELARARELRSRGDFAAAANVYRAIHQDNPHSPTGRAALLSLAGLLLSPLNDASGALNAYNAYLSGGRGALTLQAEYGRIRALRGLGRSAEEQAAVEAFLSRYPNAPEARALKQAKASPASKPLRGSPH